MSVDNMGKGNGPDFIIIGGMKCATSTLHDQLALHESFFMTNPKEPNFFSNDEIYSQGIGWYSELFSSANKDQLKGESSTHYTKLPEYPDTIDRIVHNYPDLCKFIYVMRHPVDRLISHYIHQWSQGVISCGIDEAVHSFPELTNYSCYNMQLEPYLTRFSTAAVLPLFAERLRQNPQNELQTVFDFLNVIEKPNWDDTLKSNVSTERVRVCSWRDAIVENPLLATIRKTFVPKKLRTKIRLLWSMKERPVLSSATQQYVEEIFDRDLDKLGGKLGMQINCRNFREIITETQNIFWVK